MRRKRRKSCYIYNIHQVKINHEERVPAILINFTKYKEKRREKYRVEKSIECNNKKRAKNNNNTQTTDNERKNTGRDS